MEVSYTEKRLEILSKPMKSSYSPETGVYRFSISDIPWCKPKYEFGLYTNVYYQPLDSLTPLDIADGEDMEIDDADNGFVADLFTFWIHDSTYEYKIPFVFPEKDVYPDDFYLIVDKFEDTIEWILIPKSNINEERSFLLF